MALRLADPDLLIRSIKVKTFIENILYTNLRLLNDNKTLQIVLCFSFIIIFIHFVLFCFVFYSSFFFKTWIKKFFLELKPLFVNIMQCMYITCHTKTTFDGIRTQLSSWAMLISEKLYIQDFQALFKFSCLRLIFNKICELIFHFL